MGLIGWTNERIKRLDVWDMGCIKCSCIFLGIIVGAYTADFAKQYLWLLIVLAAVLIIRPLYKAYFKKQEIEE